MGKERLSGVFRAKPGLLIKLLEMHRIKPNAANLVRVASETGGKILALATATKMIDGGACFPSTWLPVAQALGKELDELLDGYAVEPVPKGMVEWDVFTDHELEMLAEADRLEEAAEKLRRFVNASRLTRLKDAGEGSVRLRFVGPPSDYEKFLKSFQDEKLTEMGVKNVRSVKSEVDESTDRTTGHNISFSDAEDAYERVSFAEYLERHAELLGDEDGEGGLAVVAKPATAVGELGNMMPLFIHVEVLVSDSSVTLIGRVRTRYLKQLAEEHVRPTVGYRALVNDIIISI